ncbi:hypothetical protein MLD38_035797 [Melastoma candidum]|uniref:Uncharacterized protein n=1 Tax=Melastoma candidum TaxID=119954 RepID=A0ACB9LJK3_9MYRT|nr:hypothetical protein MLD38_035797 [Melastoma candidum]
MPLYKRKPFPLSDHPPDLDPSNPVFQVRFTKEIFLDYQEYLHRVDLYRRRLWTCKVTGKSNLTYEEALVSERKGTQPFPPHLVKPMLHIVQYSMLTLKNLADTIATKLQDSWLEGIETYARKDNSVFPCRIEKILDDGAGSMRCEIAWLGKDQEVLGNAVVTRKDIISKKPPYSRNALMSFIRESTWRNAPWVIHDKLAEKHGISKDLPEELKGKFAFHHGKLVRMKVKRKICKEEGESMERGPDGKCKKMKVDCSQIECQGLQCIKYPIEDLLVQPGPDDPAFADRPAPSRDFKVPMTCVADLLMVWDFCSSFSRLINLYPFSLEDFENSICHKDGSLALLVESHSALLHLLIRDGGEYFSALQRKKRNFKITLINWAEYLSDFLDMANRQDLSTHVATIKRGHYGLLSADVKLDIFGELVYYALQTDILRDQLDEHIDQWQELGATRRGEALEEGRKKREAKQPLHRSGPFLNRRNCDALSISKEKMNKREENDVHKHENAHGGTGKNDEISKNSKELRKHYYEREMEKRFIRTNSLGKDRDRNRYWWFHRDGRIFVESSDNKIFGFYDTKKELDALMGSLNSKGERERALQKQLEKFYSRICLGLQKGSKDLAEKVALEEAVLRRSTRVRAPPRESPATACLRYVNKWKED